MVNQEDIMYKNKSPANAAPITATDSMRALYHKSPSQK